MREFFFFFFPQPESMKAFVHGKPEIRGHKFKCYWEDNINNEPRQLWCNRKFLSIRLTREHTPHVKRTAAVLFPALCLCKNKYPLWTESLIFQNAAFSKKRSNLRTSEWGVSYSGPPVSSLCPISHLLLEVTSTCPHLSWKEELTPIGKSPAP